MPRLDFDTAVLGAGAAGLFCAANLPCVDKIIIDHNPAAGLKLLATGGGNCNFTNASVSFNDYYSQNPRFAASALAAFKPSDFLAILKQNKIEFELRGNNQYFAFSARAILDMLLGMINKDNTQFAYNTQIAQVSFKDGLFEIDCHTKTFRAKKLVVALGGKSYAKLGATDKALKIAKTFGIPSLPVYPALTGLVFGEQERSRFTGLAGLSCAAKISCGKKEQAGAILFTHEGLSGPAVFKLSLYGLDGEVKVNFLPSVDVLEYLMANKNSIKKPANLLEEILPKKLAQAFCAGFETKMADAKKSDIIKLALAVNGFTFKPAGTCGYDRAEVMAGGIDTRFVSSKTMEALKTPNLFFAGECLDVTGQLGGYNLHWAWASACAAAKAIEQRKDI